MIEEEELRKCFDVLRELVGRETQREQDYHALAGTYQKDDPARNDVRRMERAAHKRVEQIRAVILLLIKEYGV